MTIISRYIVREEQSNQYYSHRARYLTDDINDAKLFGNHRKPSGYSKCSEEIFFKVISEDKLDLFLYVTSREHVLQLDEDKLLSRMSNLAKRNPDYKLTKCGSLRCTFKYDNKKEWRRAYRAFNRLSNVYIVTTEIKEKENVSA